MTFAIFAVFKLWCLKYHQISWANMYIMVMLCRDIAAIIYYHVWSWFVHFIFWCFCFGNMSNPTKECFEQCYSLYNAWGSRNENSSRRVAACSACVKCSLLSIIVDPIQTEIINHQSSAMISMKCCVLHTWTWKGWALKKLDQRMRVF